MFARGGHNSTGSPPPDVRTSANPSNALHPLRDAKVLGTVIAADPARDSVAMSAVEEELEDGGCAVVGVDANAGDETGVTVNETMDDGFPPDKTCARDERREHG